MDDGSSDERSAPFSEGFGVPIAGLLAVLFALLAGVSAYPAISGAPGGVAVPVTFGAASVAFAYLQQRYARNRDDGDS